MKLRIILLIIVFCFLLIWVGSIIKCEVLTALHGDEFNAIYKENNMIGEIEYLKILEYSNKVARVYYISLNKSSGNILKFSKIDEQWKYDKWEQTVWSTSGTADGVVWPYLWHFFYSH